MPLLVYLFSEKFRTSCVDLPTHLRIYIPFLQASRKRSAPENSLPQNFATCGIRLGGGPAKSEEYDYTSSPGSVAKRAADASIDKVWSFWHSVMSCNKICLARACA